MQLDKLDIGFSVLMLMAGVWVMLEAVGYGVFGMFVTGPGFFPFAAGALMTVSTIFTLISQVRRQRPIDAALALGDVLPVAIIVALTVLLLILLERVGILVLMPFYIAGVSYAIERPARPGQHIMVWVTAGIFTTFAYILFGYLLRVPLPYGLFQQAY